jgi:D-lactate dehydrogenase (cytochrome)
MNRFGVFRRFAHHRRTAHRVWDRYAITTALIVGSLAGYYGAQYVEVPKHRFPQGSISSVQDVKSPRYAEYEKMAHAFHKIKQLLNEDQWSSHKSDLESSNTNDYSTHQPKGTHQHPKLVVYPHTTEQVSEIVKICYSYAVPIVPISGGTSIEGNFISTRNGIVISLAQMDKIIQLNEQDLDCTLQAGVGWQDLNEYLIPYGFFLGPDPGPGASIGGMCGTSCSGTNAARYGTMKDNVVNLTVVLPDGTVVKTKQRPRKSSSGYNLTNLFVGSEGTLGIITEVTVKLHMRPKFEKVGVISFPRIVDATNMVTQMIQQGIQFNAVELLDGNMIDVINKSGQCKREWPVTPTLFIKLGGNDERQLVHVIQRIDDISIQNNSIGFAYSKDDQESEELWMARKVGFWSTIEYGKQNISPAVKVWTTDVAVPISKLSKVIEESMADLKQLGIFNTILGHVGDGNFHAILIYEPRQATQVKHFSERLVQRAIDNDGTCTGEHGIGMGKRKYLTWELGEDTVALMRRIKLSIDPKRIMNPDKVFSIDEDDVV